MSKVCRLPARGSNNKYCTADVIKGHISKLTTDSSNGSENNTDSLLYFARLVVPDGDVTLARKRIFDQKGNISQKKIDQLCKDVETYLAEFAYELSRKGTNSDLFAKLVDKFINGETLDSSNLQLLFQIYNDRKFAKRSFRQQNQGNNANKIRKTNAHGKSELQTINESEIADRLQNFMGLMINEEGQITLKTGDDLVQTFYSNFVPEESKIGDYNDLSEEQKDKVKDDLSKIISADFYEKSLKNNIDFNGKNYEDLTDTEKEEISQYMKNFINLYEKFSKNKDNGLLLERILNQARKEYLNSIEEKILSVDTKTDSISTIYRVLKELKIPLGDIKEEDLISTEDNEKKDLAILQAEKDILIKEAKGKPVAEKMKIQAEIRQLDKEINEAKKVTTGKKSVKKESKEKIIKIFKNIQLHVSANRNEQKKFEDEEVTDENIDRDEWDDKSAEIGVYKSLSAQCHAFMSRIPLIDANGKIKRNNIGTTTYYSETIVLDAIMKYCSTAQSSEEIMQDIDNRIRSISPKTIESRMLQSVLNEFNKADAGLKTKLFVAISKAHVNYLEVNNQQNGKAQSVQLKNVKTISNRIFNEAQAAVKKQYAVYEGQVPFYLMSKDKCVLTINQHFQALLSVNTKMIKQSFIDAENSGGSREELYESLYQMAELAKEFLQMCGFNTDHIANESYNYGEYFSGEYNLILPIIDVANKVALSLSEKVSQDTNNTEVWDIVYNNNLNNKESIKRILSEYENEILRSTRINEKNYFSYVNGNPVLEQFEDGIYQVMAYNNKDLYHMNETDLWSCWYEVYNLNHPYIEKLVPLPLFADRKLLYFRQSKSSPNRDQDRKEIIESEIKRIIRVASRAKLLQVRPEEAISNYDVKINENRKIKNWGGANFLLCSHIADAKVTFRTNENSFLGYNVELKTDSPTCEIIVNCNASDVPTMLLNNNNEIALIDLIRNTYSGEIDISNNELLKVKTLLFDSSLLQKLGDYEFEAIRKECEIKCVNHLVPYVTTEINKVDKDGNVQQSLYTMVDRKSVIKRFDKDNSIFKSILVKRDSFSEQILQQMKNDGVVITNSKEFMANEIYTMSEEQIRQRLVDIHIFDNFIHDMIYNNFVYINDTFGDVAYAKNFVDFIKRNKVNTSSGTHLDIEAKWNDEQVGKREVKCIYYDDQVESVNDAEIDELIDKIEAEGKCSKGIVENLKKSFKDINTTDGQSFLTFTGYRRLEIMRGNWNNAKERIYQQIKNGEKANINYAEMQAMFLPIKTISNFKEKIPYRYLNENGIEIETELDLPVIHKDSEALNPLVFLSCQEISEKVRNSTSFKRLQNIMAFAEKNDIDKIASISSVKIGNYKVLSNDMIDQLGENSVLPNGYIHTIDNRFKYVQQTNEDHGCNDNTCVFSSQIMKILNSNVNDSENFNLNGEIITGKELKRRYNEVLGLILGDEFLNIEEKFNNPQGILNFIDEVVKDENMSLDPKVRELLEIAANGEFVVPTELNNVRKAYESLLLSCIQKKLGKIKLPGGLYVQKSNFGFSEDLHIVMDEKGQLAVECYLPMYSQEMYQDFLQQDGTIDINSIPNEMKELMGVRIPTVDRNYGIKLIVKGFSPRAEGSRITLPTILTDMNGSDFDIDKLYVTRPVYEKAANYDQMKKEWTTNQEDTNNPRMTFLEYYKSKNEGKIPWRKAESNITTRKGMNNALFDLSCALLSGGSLKEQQLHKADLSRHKRASMVGEIMQRLTKEELRFKVNELILKGEFTPEPQYKNGFTEKDYKALASAVLGVQIINDGTEGEILATQKNQRTAPHASYMQSMPQEYCLSETHLMAILDNGKAVSAISPISYSEMLAPLMDGKNLTAIFAIQNGAISYAQEKSLFAKQGKSAICLNGNAELDKTSENKIPSEQDAKRLGSIQLSTIAKEMGYHSKTEMISGYCDLAVDNAKEMALNGLGANKLTAGIIGVATALGYTPITITTLLNMPIIRNAIRENEEIDELIKKLKFEKNVICSIIADNTFAYKINDKVNDYTILEGNRQDPNQRGNWIKKLQKCRYGRIDLMFLASLEGKKEYSRKTNETGVAQFSIGSANRLMSEYQNENKGILKIKAVAIDNLIHLAYLSKVFSQIAQRSRTNTSSGNHASDLQSLNSLKIKYSKARGLMTNQVSSIIPSEHDKYFHYKYIVDVNPDNMTPFINAVESMLANNPSNKQRKQTQLRKLINQATNNGLSFYDFFEFFSIEEAEKLISPYSIFLSENFKKMEKSLGQATKYAGKLGIEEIEDLKTDFIKYLFSCAYIPLNDGTTLIDVDVEAMINEGKIKVEKKEIEGKSTEFSLVFPEQTIEIGGYKITLDSITYIGKDISDFTEMYKGEIIDTFFTQRGLVSNSDEMELTKGRQAQFIHTLQNEIAQLKLDERIKSSALISSISYNENNKLITESTLTQDIITKSREEFNELLFNGTINGIQIKDGKTIANHLIRYSLQEEAMQGGGQRITVLMDPRDICCAGNGMVRQIFQRFCYSTIDGRGPANSLLESFKSQFFYQKAKFKKIKLNGEISQLSEKQALSLLQAGQFTNSQQTSKIQPLMEYFVDEKNVLYKLKGSHYAKIYYDEEGEKEIEIYRRNEDGNEIEVSSPHFERICDLSFRKDAKGEENKDYVPQYFFGLKGSEYIKNIESQSAKIVDLQISAEEKKEIIKQDIAWLKDEKLRIENGKTIYEILNQLGELRQFELENNLTLFSSEDIEVMNQATNRLPNESKQLKKERQLDKLSTFGYSPSVDSEDNADQDFLYLERQLIEYNYDVEALLDNREDYIRERLRNKDIDIRSALIELVNTNNIENRSITVAPYFNEDFTNDNNGTLVKNARDSFLTAATVTAASLGLKIKPQGIKQNLSVKTGDGINNQTAQEVNYTIELEAATEEQTALFASLLGDIGYQVAESVITNKSCKNINESNCIEYRIKYDTKGTKARQEIAKSIKEKFGKNRLFNYTITPNGISIYLNQSPREIKEYSDVSGNFLQLLLDVNDKGGETTIQERSERMAKLKKCSLGSYRDVFGGPLTIENIKEVFSKKYHSEAITIIDERFVKNLIASIKRLDNKLKSSEIDKAEWVRKIQEKIHNEIRNTLLSENKVIFVENIKDDKGQEIDVYDALFNTLKKTNEEVFKFLKIQITRARRFLEYAEVVKGIDLIRNELGKEATETMHYIKRDTISAERRAKIYEKYKKELEISKNGNRQNELGKHDGGNAIVQGSSEVYGGEAWNKADARRRSYAAILNKAAELNSEFNKRKREGGDLKINAINAWNKRLTAEKSEDLNESIEASLEYQDWKGQIIC